PPVLDAVEDAPAEALASRNLWHVRVRHDAGGDDNRASLDDNASLRPSGPDAIHAVEAGDLSTRLNRKLTQIRVPMEICEKVLARGEERRGSRKPEARQRGETLGRVKDEAVVEIRPRLAELFAAFEHDM